MNIPTDTWSETVERLDRLEGQHQRLRRAVLVALCVLPLGLAAFAIDPHTPVVQAERVELVGAGGKRQAVLKADSAGIDLLLFDAKERITSAIRLGADSTLRVLDGRGTVVATLGGPRVRLVK